MRISRRTFIQRIAAGLAALCAWPAARTLSPLLAHAAGAAEAASIPTRLLGKTGERVSLFGLGGEGVLRTHRRQREAGRVITKALDLGVTYCDTAPAYSQSQDYYGGVLGERRQQVFLASKTHDRSRDGSLRLLDDSLKRLRTDHLDLWQLHDLRDKTDLEQIFDPKRGAMAAMLQAKQEGRVRFLGITGHNNPNVLLDAMHLHDFDTVLVALNAADTARLSFIESVLPAARRRNMGVIGMKVVARGALLKPRGPLTVAEAMHYVLSLQGVSTVILGCETPEEVEENVRIAKSFETLSAEAMQHIVKKSLPHERAATSYKR